MTSAGSGSQAALDAERWISEHGIGGLDPEGDDEGGCHPEDYEGWTMKQVPYIHIYIYMFTLIYGGCHPEDYEGWTMKQVPYYSYIYVYVCVNPCRV